MTNNVWYAINIKRDLLVSPKVKVMTRLEFELTYYDVTVQYVCHYATGSLFVLLKLNKTGEKIL